MKSIIATASFTIPSPKTKENSFGCSSYLIIDIAAMTSEEHSKELNTKHSLNPIVIGYHPYTVAFGSSKYISNFPVETKPRVRPVNTKNVTIVPKTPKSKIYPMLSKNLLLLMLNPEANMIGGKQT